MKQEIIKKAQKQFNTKVYNNAKAGQIVSFTNLKVVYPSFKNIFNKTCFKVEAIYNNAFSDMDGEIIHVTVPIN